MDSADQTVQKYQDIKLLIEDILNEIGKPGDKRAFRSAVYFLADNCFFGFPWKEGKSSLLISEKNTEDLKEHLAVFLAHQEDGKDEKLTYLKNSLTERFPVTMDRLLHLQGISKKSKSGDVFQLYDFMEAFLEKEVHEMNNREIEDFVKRMDATASKEAVVRFAFFSSWMKKTYEVGYTVDFQIEKRTISRATEAFSFHIICRLFYYIFTEENNYSPAGKDGLGMFQMACDDPEYLDTFLYLSIHLLCALRDTDILLLPLPEVTDPGDVLDRIRANTLTDEEARGSLHSVMEHIGCLAPVPNKVRETSMVPGIYLYIPRSLEPHFGKLLLIAAAHRILYEKEFLSQRVTSYWKLRDLMGNEIAGVFRERDMSPTAFSKSFMQGLALLARGEGGALQRAMLGYQLASRARSHKGGFGKYAESTNIYLKDNALTGLNESMIACELFERGILSSIPSMLLSLVSQGSFENLAFTQQTMLIQKLGLNTMEVEKVMGAFMKARAKSRETIMQFMRMPGCDRKEGIRSLLHNLAIGMAPGKDPDVSCFIVALDRPCPYPCQSHCLGCRFRIDTRATLFQLKGEFQRLSALKEQAVLPGEKLKYKLILSQYLLPALTDVMSVATDELGEDAARYIGLLLTEKAGREFGEDS